MRPRLIGLVVAALAVLQPASAYGRNICVDQFPLASPPPAACTGGFNEVQLDLQTALTNAQTYAGLDTVIIEPGTHTSSGSGFVYDSGADLNNTVEIVGAGPATRLARPTAGTVLEVRGVTSSRIANLTLVPFPGTVGTTSKGVRVSSASIDGVTVDPGGATGYTTGIELGSGTLRNVTSALPQGTNLTNIGARVASDSVHTVVEGGTFSGGTIGLDLAGPTTVSGARITGSLTGLRAAGDVTIVDSQIRATPSNASQAAISLITSRNASLFTHHVTIVGSNASGSAGIRTSVSAGAIASVNLRNSIVRDVAFTFDRQQTGGGGPLTNIEATHSDFTTTFTGNGIGTYSADASNVNVDPAFVDPAAGDYRLAAGSPVVDRGSPDTIFGEPAVDLAGSPRIVDGDGDGSARRDMGAFEFQPPPPGTGTTPDPGGTPPGGTPPGGTTPSAGAGETPGATAGNALATTVDALRLAPKRFLAATSGAAVADVGRRNSKTGTVVSFTLSGAGAPAFVLERRTTGRRSKGKCVKTTRRNRRARKCVRYVAVKKSAFNRTGLAGTNAFRLSGRVGRKALAPGGYRLVATSGTSVKRAAFTVKRPPRNRKR
jgi:hypothetical protein